MKFSFETTSTIQKFEPENNRRYGLRVRSAADIAGFTAGNKLVQIWSRSGHRVALEEPVNVPGHHTLR